MLRVILQIRRGIRKGEIMISINDLQPQLEVLKSVFPLNERQNELFDEFVREHEFGLALHIVCDHILESNSGAVDKP